MSTRPTLHRRCEARGRDARRWPGRTETGSRLTRLENHFAAPEDVARYVAREGEMIMRPRITQIPAHLDWSRRNKVGVRRCSSMRILRHMFATVLSGFIFRPFMFFTIPGLLLLAFALRSNIWIYSRGKQQIQHHRRGTTPHASDEGEQMTGRSKRFLITGAAGFLGSNLVERVLKDGHEAVGIDNLCRGRIEHLAAELNNRSFRFLQRDVIAPATFNDIGGDFDCIVHLAGFKIPRYGKAIDTLKINYQGTENALEFTRRLGCKIVLASTSDVYGRNPQLPFSEEGSNSVIGSSKSPRWAYAVSKLFVEHLALAYQDAYGFPVVLLRLFGSYGPRQNLTWWGGPQSVFIDCVLNDKPIPIHGDGKQTRTFTYVSDTVEGIYQAMMSSKANGEVINIGSNEEITILELAHRIKKLSGTPGELQIEFIPYESFTGKKYEDVMRRVPDIRLCEQLLGVRARVGIDDGLARTIDWQRRFTAALRSQGA